MFSWAALSQEGRCTLIQGFYPHNAMDTVIRRKWDQRFIGYIGIVHQKSLLRVPGLQ